MRGAFGRLLSVCLVALLVPSLCLAGTAGAGKGERKPIKWADSIDWTTWEEGSKAAGESGKRICLVIYADWCPQCHKLAPVFQGPEVVSLAKDLVMIRQNQDENPKWLKQYGKRYVPRIFFLEADGTLLPDLTSGHKRFEFYYWPGNKNLVPNMRAAASKEEPADPAGD